MGLPPTTKKNIENLTKRFSDDVLSIEISGPEHRHLSVVDVPGLFHSERLPCHRYDVRTSDLLEIPLHIRPRTILRRSESLSGHI